MGKREGLTTSFMTSGGKKKRIYWLDGKRITKEKYDLLKSKPIIEAKMIIVDKDGTMPGYVDKQGNVKSLSSEEFFDPEELSKSFETASSEDFDLLLKLSEVEKPKMLFAKPHKTQKIKITELSTPITPIVVRPIPPPASIIPQTKAPALVKKAMQAKPATSNNVDNLLNQIRQGMELKPAAKKGAFKSEASLIETSLLNKFKKARGSSSSSSSFQGLSSEENILMEADLIKISIEKLYSEMRRLIALKKSLNSSSPQYQKVSNEIEKIREKIKREQASLKKEQSKKGQPQTHDMGAALARAFQKMDF